MARSRRIGNWVDRGAPADEKLLQVLAHYLGCAEAVDAPDSAWLREAARDIAGMVAANASEVQVAGYVRSLARARGRSPEEVRGARLVAVALWHVAKAAEVRDRAVQALRAAGALDATREPLGDWLAKRLLSPEEHAAYRAERARASCAAEPSE
jgi:hypothetical protein